MMFLSSRQSRLFSSFVPAAAALATFLAAPLAAAQFCLPGTPICAGKDGVTVTGPGVNQGAGTSANPSGNAGGTVQGQGQTTFPNVVVTPPKVDYTPQWSSYLAWRARIQASVKVRVRAQIQAELEANLRLTLPNPYLGLTPPVRYVGEFGAGSGSSSTAGEFGLIGLTIGAISGQKSPIYFGYTLPVRIPVSDDLLVAADTSMLMMIVDEPGHNERGDRNTKAFGAFQFRPGIVNQILRGASNTYVYWRAGAHLTVPTGGGAVVPDIYLGPSAGIGLHGGSTITYGLEWNVDGWQSFGGKRAPDYDGFRVGTDVRGWIGVGL